MFDYIGQIVRSDAGHDKGDLLLVVGVQEAYLLLSDGTRRRTATPKRKKLKHVSCEGTSEHPATKKLAAGAGITNREVRGVLAQHRAVTANAQGGN